MSSLTLELGSGRNPYRTGWKDEVIIHTDIQELDCIEKIMDFDKRFTFPNNKFDKVIAYHVLEHTKDLDFTIKEIHRVLKPNGRLIVRVPAWCCNDAHYEFHTRFFRYWSLADYTIEQGSSASGVYKPLFKTIKRCFIYRGFKWLEWLANKLPKYDELWTAWLPFKPREFKYELEAIK